MSILLDRLVLLETEILYQEPPQVGEMEFRYVPGSIPVLISAPHGAVHTRNDRLKEEDEYTAAISRLVAELTGAHVLYAHRKSETDPNWYPDVPYKLSLRRILEQARIGFLLDLHGASERRDFGLALGTMFGESCPDQRALILDTLKKSDYSAARTGLDRLDIDQTFPAAGSNRQETVTRFAWRVLGLPAAQVEIHARLRVVLRKPDASARAPFQGDSAAIEHTVLALTNLVRAIS